MTRFSLQSVFCLIVIIALLVVWLRDRATLHDLKRELDNVGAIPFTTDTIANKLAASGCQVNFEATHVWFQGTDKNLVLAGKLQYLTFFEADRQPVTPQGLRHLRGCTRLEYLKLANLDVGDDGLVFLQSCPHIEALYLDNLNLTDDGLRYVEHLGSLTKLSLGDNPKLTDDALKYIRKLPRLEHLDLRNTSITDAALDSFQRMEKLKSLNVHGTKMSSSGKKALSTLANITELNY